MKYYTKEFIKLLKLAFIAFILISAMIIVKYKPEYKVLIDDAKIGYIESPEDIDEMIHEEIEKESDKNIAYVELRSIPQLKLELISRNSEDEQENVKEEIAKQVAIEYTNYAISLDGKNKTYVASKEEAENIVEELKKDYAKKYTEKLGIVQVYSDNYEEISTVEEKNAKNTVSKAINKVKQADIKLAQAKAAKERAAKIKAASAAVTEKSVAVTKLAKETNVNGFVFAVKPVSYILFCIA